MTILSRVRISIHKNIGKFLLLFALVTILSTMALSAVLAEQAFNQTVVHLRRSLAPIVALGPDEAALDALYTREQQSQGYAAYLFEFLSQEAIHQIGNLPYVRFFDYSIPAMGWSDNWSSYGFYNELGGAAVMFHGIANPTNIYIEYGNFELKYGRLFTVDELSMESNLEISPVLIPYELAKMNDLFIDDRFEVSVEFFDPPAVMDMPSDGFAGLTNEEIRNHVYNIWNEYSFTFQVVGIFELTDDGGTMDHWIRMNLLNTLQVPNWRTFEMLMKGMESDLAFQALFDSDLIDADNIRRFMGINEPFWILYDIADYDAFVSAGADFLPDYFVFENLSSTFDHIIQATTALRNIITRSLWFSIGMIILLLNLLIMLFLKDRRHELGIYLALGERKTNIILQLLIEVFVVSTLAAIVALGVSSLIAPAISQNLLQNQYQQNQMSQAAWSSLSALEARGFGSEMPFEEVLEIFEVSLTFWTVVLYFIAGIIVIGISVIVPIMFVLELKPKDILT